MGYAFREMVAGTSERTLLTGKLARAKSRLKGLERLVEIAEMPEVLDGLRRDIDQQKKEISQLEQKLKSA